MAEQDPKLGHFSFSQGGQPILIESSSDSAPEKIHDIDADNSGNVQLIYMKIHNKSDARATVNVRLRPTSDSSEDLERSRLVFDIPARSTRVIFDGEPVLQSPAGPSAATKGITAWAEDADDVTNKNLKVTGWILDLADPILS